MRKRVSKLNYLKIIQKNWRAKMPYLNAKIVNIQSPIAQKLRCLAKNMGAKDLADLKSIIEKQISKEYESITTQLIKNFRSTDRQYKLDLPKRMVEDETKAVEHTFIHEKMNEQKEKDHSKVKLSDSDKKEIKKYLKEE